MKGKMHSFGENPEGCIFGPLLSAGVKTYFMENCLHRSGVSVGITKTVAVKFALCF